MSGVKTASLKLSKKWQQTLADYVTAIAWTQDGQRCAAASAAGDVSLYSPLGDPVTVQRPDGASVNCLGFSADGKYLAWGGQASDLYVWSIWHVDLAFRHSYVSAWIDTLAWHPTLPLLAYGVGSFVQVVDVSTEQTVAKLDFAASSVLHLAWHPQGDRLAVSGHGGGKVWPMDDWEAAPQLIAVPGASLYCAWSADGRYLGSGNLDRTLTVAEWDSPPPWLMQGFPGKVRQLSWSTPQTKSGSPLVAAACVEGVTVWERGEQSQAGWQSQVLQHHQERVNAIAFQPNSLMLASAGQEGRIALWRNGHKLDQSIQALPQGVSCLAWSPQGDRLLAGGNGGEVKLWQVAPRARGFG